MDFEHPGGGAVNSRDKDLNFCRLQEQSKVMEHTQNSDESTIKYTNRHPDKQIDPSTERVQSNTPIDALTNK